MVKPILRILHNLARSGGTIVSRCLASMEGVALLSEIHPTRCETWNDPRSQAYEWYGSTIPEGLPFADTIAEIGYDMSKDGLSLVLRSWDFVDFIKSSQSPAPPLRSTLVDALFERFELRRVSLIREPREMLESLRKFTIEDIPEPDFMDGYRAFADMPVERVSYEEFCTNPGDTLAQVCDVLGLRYDSAWKQRWQRYRNITGDTESLDRVNIEKMVRP